MSDTKRRVQIGWGPGNPAFDQWNAGRPPARQTQSVKHQTKDRAQASLKRNHRFTKGVKNTLRNLEGKVEQLKLKEELALPDPPEPMVTCIPDVVICKICHQLSNAQTAHLHQGEYIGDECCWDERLRASE